MGNEHTGAFLFQLPFTISVITKLHSEFGPVVCFGVMEKHTICISKLKYVINMMSAVVEYGPLRKEKKASVRNAIDLLVPQ